MAGTYELHNPIISDPTTAHINDSCLGHNLVTLASPLSYRDRLGAETVKAFIELQLKRKKLKRRAMAREARGLLKGVQIGDRTYRNVDRVNITEDGVLLLRRGRQRMYLGGITMDPTVNSVAVDAGSGYFRMTLNGNFSSVDQPQDQLLPHSANIVLIFEFEEEATSFSDTVRRVIDDDDSGHSSA